MVGAQIILPPNDIAAVERTLAEHAGEVAAIILEPTGAAMGATPIDPSFLYELREVTSRDGVILIFDEVVTGFRMSPGGVQALYGVTPDLTTMAKILAGGLPGCCRRSGGPAGGDQPSPMRPRLRLRARRVAHPGTFNANLISSAAGVAALSIVATGDPHQAANAAAKRLATELNQVIRRHEVAGRVYGQGSLLHILLGKEAPAPEDGITWQWPTDEHRSTPQTDLDLVVAFRRAMITEGVDPMGARLIVGAAHGDEDIDYTSPPLIAPWAPCRRSGWCNRGGGLLGNGAMVEAVTDRCCRASGGHDRDATGGCGDRVGSAAGPPPVLVLAAFGVGSILVSRGDVRCAAVGAPAQFGYPGEIATSATSVPGRRAPEPDPVELPPAIVLSGARMGAVQVGVPGAGGAGCASGAVVGTSAGAFNGAFSGVLSRGCPLPSIARHLQDLRFHRIFNHNPVRIFINAAVRRDRVYDNAELRQMPDRHMRSTDIADAPSRCTSSPPTSPPVRRPSSPPGR
ncbi:MAG: aminotransferase class III-fold pyridoxal phosphate-dependent enzyme [Dehalococcoidia bacterium]